MTDKNTISTKNYILFHCIGAILLSALIPYAIKVEYSVWTTVFIFIVIFYECIITYRFRKNCFSVFVNLLAPAELLVLLVCRDRNSRLTAVLLFVWAAMSAVYTFLVTRSGKRRNGKPIITSNKLRWSLLGSKTLFSLVMIIAVMTLGVFYQPPPIPTQISVDELGCSVDDCEELLNRLAVNTFKTLTKEEKLDVLREVCRVEFTELGIKHGFSLECRKLDDTYLAQYSEARYTIIINDKYINRRSSFELLTGTCHECYHAYQHELMRGDDSLGQFNEEQKKKKIEIYSEELSHYCTAAEDLETYKAQRFEIDADAYKERACVKYLRFYGLSDRTIKRIASEKRH